jgi:hypothetical protein
LASSASVDAELFKLEAEIAVLNRAAQEIREQRVDPFDAAWRALAHRLGGCMRLRP